MTTLPESSEHPKPFWKTKALGDMSHAEWEALCDGCGRCCLQKLQDRKTGKTRCTSVACYLLDIPNCRCRDYQHRHYLVKACAVLTPDGAERFAWLPKTCAYRLIATGRDLAWWHPLVSGSLETVHQAGISVRHCAISEEWVHPDDLEFFILREQRF